MNPYSPLGVPKKGEYQGTELHIQRVCGTYRKTAPVSLFGAFLPVDAGELFWGPF